VTTRTHLGWILVPLLLAGAPAQADEPKKPEPEAKRSYVLVGGKLPAAREESPLSQDATSHRPAWLSAVQFDRKSGFAVRRSLAFGERDVILRLKGPVMKKKRLGLAVEIRF
jgi:hypothetical protein